MKYSQVWALEEDDNVIRIGLDIGRSIVQKSEKASYGGVSHKRRKDAPLSASLTQIHGNSCSGPFNLR